jgi:hypothetical protein
MPNCFQLTRKGDTHPSPLVLIDDLICEHFGVEPDPVKYLAGWYDSIGLKLAMGQSFPQIIASYKEYEEKYPNDSWPRTLGAIAVWLDANYTTDSWAEVGR